MRATALPGGAGKRGRDRVDETGVRVRGDQPDAGEAACDQAPEEGEPGGAVLLGDDVEPERLAVAVPVDGDRVHDARVDGASALAALDDERVQGQVRVGRPVERPRAEVLDGSSRLFASRETWLFDSRSTPSSALKTNLSRPRSAEVSDLPFSRFVTVSTRLGFWLWNLSAPGRK